MSNLAVTVFRVQRCQNILAETTAAAAPPCPSGTGRRTAPFALSGRAGQPRGDAHLFVAAPDRGAARACCASPDTATDQAPAQEPTPPGHGVDRGPPLRRRTGAQPRPRYSPIARTAPHHRSSSASTTCRGRLTRRNPPPWTHRGTVDGTPRRAPRHVTESVRGPRFHRTRHAGTPPGPSSLQELFHSGTQRVRDCIAAPLDHAGSPGPVNPAGVHGRLHVPPRCVRLLWRWRRG